MNKTFFEIKDIKLYCGHVVEVLKTLESDSINCCVTSPPYWALRNYNTNSQIWDENTNCKHIWGKKKIKKLNLQAGNPEFKRKLREQASNYKSSQGNFCIKCGSWRGELGLEPDYNLYIKHLCDIFNEIKRILKKDGTCFVNLGDTYGGTGDKGNYKDPKYSSAYIRVTESGVQKIKRSDRIGEYLKKTYGLDQ